MPSLHSIEETPIETVNVAATNIRQTTGGVTSGKPPGERASEEVKKEGKGSLKKDQEKRGSQQLHSAHFMSPVCLPQSKGWAWGERR